MHTNKIFTLSQLTEKIAPQYLLWSLGLWIFCVEFLLMLGLDHLLPPHTEIWGALLDASLLMLTLAPIYIYIYRPYKKAWTERLRAEQKIHFLSQQLLTLGEEERARLARDLHDEFGQLLTRLQLGLSTLTMQLPGTAPQLTEQGEKLMDIISELGHHVHHLATELKPSILDDLGLCRSIESYAEQLQSEVGNLHIDIDTDECRHCLVPESEIALYRIFQEALTNIVKHAHASNVWIKLKHLRDRLVLSIADDGCGFNPDQYFADQNASGIGLLGMQERIRGLGGDYQIFSEPGQGTKIRFDVPLAHQKPS